MRRPMPASPISSHVAFSDSSDGVFEPARSSKSCVKRLQKAPFRFSALLPRSYSSVNLRIHAALPTAVVNLWSLLSQGGKRDDRERLETGTEELRMGLCHGSRTHCHCLQRWWKQRPNDRDNGTGCRQFDRCS